MARRSTGLACKVLAVIGFVLLRAHPAAAEPGTFSLDWEAPAACPSASFVSEEVARLLGHAPGLAADRPVFADAKVTSVGSGFIVRIALTTSEGRGERTLRDRSCERLALATALVVSLTIDPEADATPKPAPPATVPPEAPAPPPMPPKQAPRPQRRRFTAGVEAGVDLGIFPDPDARLSALFGVSWRALRYELAVGYDFPEFAPAPGNISRGANLWLATLKVRSCLMPIDGVLEVGGCLSVEGGFFFAEGVRISAPLNKAYPWAAVLAGARLEWHAGGTLSFRLEADGGPSLVRPSFEIMGSLPAFVHEPSRFVAEGALGAMVRFR
jgi:hypothetical protein